MPHVIKWSERAQLDLIRLYGFLATKSQDAARRGIDTIRLGTMVLAEHPEVGRPVLDAPMEIRDWAVPFGVAAYIIRYHFDGKTIVILAVRHGREAGF